MSDFFTLFGDRIGLVCCAFSAAAALAALFPKKARAFALPALFAALLVPIRGCGAANLIFALIDIPSLTLVIGCAFLALGKKSPLKNAELAAVAVLELALVLTELDFIPCDLYGWGYRGEAAAAAASLGVLFLAPSRWPVLVAAYLLWRLGIYQNMFDALVDPVCAIAAAGLLIGRAFRAVRVSRANGPGRCGEVRESAPPRPCDR